MTWSVVVPTVRPERFKQFIDAWDDLFTEHGVTLYVIQDLPASDKQIEEACQARSFDIELFSWETITEAFFPRKSDMIRSFGIHKAWESKSDYTLTLDDDVLPTNDLFSAYERAFAKGAVYSPYFDVGTLTTFDGQMRGFPFRERERKTVAVQYGGWSGVLDYDAPTQLAGVNDTERWYPLVVPVPRGAAVTGCIMNAAWRTEYASIMWQLPLLYINGKGLYNRFGDIWAGLFAKKTLDHVGEVMVVNGEATVRHERASDPMANLEREGPGIPVNERLWENLKVSGGDLLDAYEQVTRSAFEYFRAHNRFYADHFLSCRDQWLELFQ